MRVGIKSQPRRGVVAIRGYNGGHFGFANRKMSLDIQVVDLDTVQKAAAENDLADLDRIANRCRDFAVDLHALFLKYGIELFEEAP